MHSAQNLKWLIKLITLRIGYPANLYALIIDAQLRHLFFFQKETSV